MARSRDRRKDIRKKLRVVTDRRKRPEAAPTPKARPAPEPVGSIKCLCGKELTIFRSDDRKQVYCAECERSIKIGFVSDPNSDAVEIIPIFPPDPGLGGDPSYSDISDSFPTPEPRVDQPTAVGPATLAEVPESLGLTPVPELVAAEAALPVLPKAEPREPDPPAKPGPKQVGDRPAPPAALPFKCTCGRGLVAKRDVYGTRLKCHRCGTWLAIEPSYDEPKKLWQIIPKPSSEPTA